MSNPVEEYLKTKTAGAMDYGRQMLQGAGNAFGGENVGKALAGSAVVAGGAAVGAAVSKIMGALTKKRDFDAMMQHAPDLAAYHSANPDQFNRHYSSFRAMNPTFAKDPVVASTYMRQMSEYPETAGKVIVESLGALPRSSKSIDLKLGKEGPQVSLKG